MSYLLSLCLLALMIYDRPTSNNHYFQEKLRLVLIEDTQGIIGTSVIELMNVGHYDFNE